MNIFITALPCIYMTIGYTGLLPAPMKLKYYFFLFIYLFPLYYWSDLYFGQWGTLPLVLGNSLIIYIGCQRNLLSLALALSGHIVLILIEHLFMIPLSFVGKTIPFLHEYHEIIVSLVLVFTAFIALRLIRRFFVLPKISILCACPGKLMKCFLAELYIGISLLATNFIYGESVSYPTEVLSFNGLLITFFTLSIIMTFYNMHDILQKNQELRLQQAQAVIMRDYAHRMESLYEDIRVFRHDYRNILAAMQQYIDGGNMEALKGYFHKVILNSAPVLSDDGFYLGRLHQLEDDALKSLLYTKIVAVLNNGINLNLEIAEPVPSLPVDSLVLCRILGILLDNAAEAAMASPEKDLRISIASDDLVVIFMITNSTLPVPVPVSDLIKRGYSTKQGHDGIGLATVMRFLDDIPHANLSIKYEDAVFSQSLEIQKYAGINTG